MNVKELRIGALIEYGSLNVKSLDDVVYERVVISITLLRKLLNEPMDWIWRPVPITKELLSHFEFKLITNGDDYFYSIGCLNIGEDNFEVFLQEKNEDYIMLEHVKYIHQIQNLHFALTGRDLVYTP